MRHQRPRGGRIINNGSISAHAPRPGSVAYTATKHAITGLTRSTSLDGRAYDIACGQIDIGNAAIELTEPMAGGVPQADGSVRPEPRMEVTDVARAVLYMAGLPLDANVATMTVMATKMPFVGAARLAGHHLLGPARRGRLLGCRRFGYGAGVKRTGRRAGPEMVTAVASGQG